MSRLATAIRNTPDALTENGALTHSSSKNALVDLFFMVGGASLNKTPMQAIINLFEDAYQADPERAIRILHWIRDIRGGAGRREIYRRLMKHLEKTRPQVAKQFLRFAPHFGRFDDLLIFDTHEVKKAAFKVYGQALLEKNGLAGKWAPRQKGQARELREYLRLTPKQYRKLIVGLSKTVEQDMCANNWSEIDYQAVPSLASIRYAKAFARHDTTRYSTFKEALEKGEAKVNTGAIYPHDVVVSLRTGDAQLANSMWNQLPDFVGNANIIAMSDVSGSMMQAIQGNVQAIDVSVALGLYTASKNTGPFADMFMTFSSNPEFVTFKPSQTLKSKYDQAKNASWGMSTNLQAAFDAILDLAVRSRASQEDMPEMLLILSDMEFNQCTERSTNFQAIERKYEQAGYKMPKLVFWSLNGRNGNVPIQYNQDGVALVSGFSPAILKSILSAKEFNPVSVMDATIMTPRYDALFN